MAVETTDQKALRLIANNNLNEANARTYVTIGDSGTYITTVIHINNADDSWGPAFTGSCTCQWDKHKELPVSKETACSHLKAAMTLSDKKMKEV